MGVQPHTVYQAASVDGQSALFYSVCLFVISSSMSIWLQKDFILVSFEYDTFQITATSARGAYHLIK